jgi:hypothetical protein
VRELRPFIENPAMEEDTSEFAMIPKYYTAYEFNDNKHTNTTVTNHVCNLSTNLHKFA